MQLLRHAPIATSSTLLSYVAVPRRLYLYVRKLYEHVFTGACLPGLCFGLDVGACACRPLRFDFASNYERGGRPLLVFDALSKR